MFTIMASNAVGVCKQDIAIQILKPPPQFVMSKQIVTACVGELFKPVCAQLRFHKDMQGLEFKVAPSLPIGLNFSHFEGTIYGLPEVPT